MSVLLPQNKIDRLKKIAAISSVSLAVGLCLLKVIGAALSGSLSIFSSMIDSLSDIIASLITLISIRISGRPASCDYRYGYGKVEALSALAQALFIAVSGGFILYDAIWRLIEHRYLSQTVIGIAIMVISLILTLILVAFQRHVAKLTNSQAIMADSQHYSVDIYTNLAIIASLAVIYWWHIYWIDAAMAIAAAIYLLHVAWKLGRYAASLLLDKELGEDIRRRVIEIVASHPLHPDIHDLRTRDLGGHYMFEFHLELDGAQSLLEAHRHTEEVETLLRQTYPDAQIIIHQDPKGIDEERLDRHLTGSGCSISTKP